MLRLFAMMSRICLTMSGFMWLLPSASPTLRFMVAVSGDAQRQFPPPYSEAMLHAPKSGFERCGLGSALRRQFEIGGAGRAAARSFLSDLGH